MRVLTHSLVILAFIGCAAPVVAAGLSSMGAVCESQMPDIVMTPKDPPDGTMTQTLQMMQLSGAAIMAGTRTNQRQLVGQPEANGTRTVVFEPADGKRWLSCEYGGAAGMKVVLWIDDKATSCTLAVGSGRHPGSVAASAKCT